MFDPRQQKKTDFLKVINYMLRHNKIILFLICHNIVHNNLYSDILYAPHLFLSYSNIGFAIIRYEPHFIMKCDNNFRNCSFFRKLYSRLGGAKALTFYQVNEWQNYHFAYINSKKNYLINNSDVLLDGHSTTMFYQNQVFTIHPQEKPCGQPTTSPLPSSLAESIHHFLQTNYPKQKLLTLVFDPLIQKDLINENFYFKINENVHIIDFIRWLNNRFDKNEKPPNPLKPIIKTLQIEKIRFPHACVLNPVAKRLLC